MAFPVNSLVEVTHFLELQGQQCLVVYHMGYAIDYVPTEDLTMSTIANGESLKLRTDVLTLLTDRISYRGVRTRTIVGHAAGLVPPARKLVYGFEHVRVEVPPVAGGNVGQALPAHDAVTCRKYSALSGRMNRGSQRWPGLIEDNQIDGLLTALAFPNFQAAFQTFYLADRTFPPEVGTFNCTIFSKKHYFARPAASTPRGSASLIVRVQANEYVGTQNSRKHRGTPVIA